MSNSEIRLPPGELLRLAECVLEPIRFPDAIQPHGVLLVARRADLLITHVSDNSAEMIGADPVALMGRPLEQLLGSATIAQLHDVLDPEHFASNPVSVQIEGQPFDAVVHADSEALLVDLEPLDPDFGDQTAVMRTAFRRLSTARTIPGLWEQTAIELSRITRFDRVMVYHFYPDEHGEVVAEVAAEGMEAYLGLHYPASDIPAQARQLYLTKLSRGIASSAPRSAALLGDANADVLAPLDLSLSELRAVSPHHLEFMRNMGQASTFSLSLISGDRLVGMITCAHRTERRIPYRTREALEILANQISLQLASMVEIDGLRQRNQLRDIRAKLLAQVGSGFDLAESLVSGPLTLLDLVTADAAVIHSGDRLVRIGSAPSDEQIAALRAELAKSGSLAFASSAIRLDEPQIADILPTVAGALVLPFGRDGDFVAWFREEVTKTVDWLGDMSPANRVSTLSPRNSFSAWTQEYTGTSLPWDELEQREARELCRDLDSVLLRRVEAQLAELALRDSLTGLPNRRLLMDRLAQSIARTDLGVELAVLFIDLDGFKAINDTHGHATGDEALRFVAQRLAQTARREDTVARLGGDEFVVLCETVTAEEASQIAARILQALGNATVPAPAWTIGASIGIAMADAHSDASQLLSAADSAMYRAKVAGRNRIEFAPSPQP